MPDVRGYDGLAFHVDACLDDLGYEASDADVGDLALESADMALETIERGIADLIATGRATVIAEDVAFSTDTSGVHG